MIFSHIAKNKRKTGLVVSVLLAAAIAVSGTFAWFTAKDSVTNRLSTDMVTDGSTTIVEIFNPPTIWKPGEEVTKRVYVVNTGSGDVLVRVSFEEILSKLKQPAKAKTAPLSGTEVPQLFNKDAFASWATLQSLGITTSPALPQGVEVRAKRIPENPQPNDPVTYTFVAWYTIPAGGGGTPSPFAGQAQRVTADFALNGTTLGVSNLAYWAYDGKDTTEASWAHFVDPKTGATPSAPPRADIGTPKTDITGKMIHLIYADQAVSGTTPTAGKWWYNETDGFFYYIGKVASGAMSGELLKSLKLDEKADVAYTGLDFDLIVNLEVIQNSKDAIRSNTGWNLANDQTMLTALDGFCV
ncbi:MAG: BsaA family SipW-dependent biofilm matrix protein [Clostridiales Family XIII bacterium]|nr:BsaA family SipW-dependent biofilm matrix protein [Clostridiales Family XIII bacterium]